MNDGDALSSGGVFHPEQLEIQGPELTQAELDEQRQFESEARALKILVNSTAWMKIREEFTKEVEDIKHNLAKVAVLEGKSLEDIGMEFKIGQICEQRIMSLINRVEQNKEAK